MFHPEYDNFKIDHKRPDFELAEVDRFSAISHAYYRFSNRKLMIIYEEKPKGRQSVSQSEIDGTEVTLFADPTEDKSRLQFALRGRDYPPAVLFLDCYSCKRKFIRLVYDPKPLHLHIIRTEFAMRGINMDIKHCLPRKQRSPYQEQKYYEMFPKTDGDYAMFVFAFNKHIVFHKNERLLKPTSGCRI